MGSRSRAADRRDARVGAARQHRLRRRLPERKRTPFEIAVPQETGEGQVANYLLQSIGSSKPAEWPFVISMSNGGSSTTDPNFATRLEKSAHRLCADAAARIDTDLREALIAIYAELPTEQTSAFGIGEAPQAIEDLCARST